MVLSLVRFSAFLSTKYSISHARTENLDERIAEQLPAIQEKEQVKAVIKVRDEYRIATGKAVFALSPFNSERININGLELYRNSFISDRPITDPFFEETKLYFDDETERWLTRIKNGLPKLISRFVIVACLIIDASGPGIRRTIIKTDEGFKVREGCKTEKSQRQLELPDYIYDMIMALPHTSDEDFIVPLTRKSLYSRFSRLIKKHDILCSFSVNSEGELFLLLAYSSLPSK